MDALSQLFMRDAAIRENSAPYRYDPNQKRPSLAEIFNAEEKARFDKNQQLSLDSSRKNGQTGGMGPMFNQEEIDRINSGLKAQFQR